MLFLVGLSIIKGVRALFRMPPGIFRAIALTATLYVVMHVIFAYVDMSWFTQSMVYMGTMMGVIGCLEEVVGKPVRAPANRWPWQPVPEPVPGLTPLDER